ncbi:Alpha/Beta hydrolase protein [Roridomyces roridus]|uniref:Carboxypeptidase n=1 Tax=Roridomyces roridus TaxID=1738132 RepID=A0AAD7AYI5_9AGAR|nr:Alpha/Beta hydrolase protein [Roridomyces roridus]
MLLPKWLALAVIPSATLALKSTGEIPERNGVIGGVGDKSFTIKTTPAVARTPGKLRVTENSGICETTQNVYQASGYGDIAANQSIWFWYFDARKNPANAPLVLWFNGGPGSSSMIGLLQENGPCRITNDSYIDQPVGVGFSHGEEKVGTSEEAAADLWTFLQMFLADERFAHLVKNDLGIWTESYGGHYGPVFAKYFLAQNTAIRGHTTAGVHLNMKALGIGNGITDSFTQYSEYITYAEENPYVVTLVPTDWIADAKTAWNQTGGCKDQIIACNNGGNDTVQQRIQQAL